MSAPFQNNLDDYRKNHPEESDLITQFYSLLTLPDAFYRTCRPGHFTASALILSSDKSQVLLVKHRKLGIWVQPGGHADGDEVLEAVARKEVEEETGISELVGRKEILDLDIHPIPVRKDETRHDHYDIRYMYIADPELPLKISHESTDLRWISIRKLREFTREESMFRMLKKAGAL